MPVKTKPASEPISFIKFKGSMPGKLANMPMGFPTTEVKSKYAPATAKYTNVSATVYKALKIYSGTADGRYFIGRRSNGLVFEKEQADGTWQAVETVRTKDSIHVYGTHLTGDPSDPQTTGKAYTISTHEVNGHEGTSVLACMMGYILEDAEASDAYENMKLGLSKDENDIYWDDPENVKSFARLLALFGDNYYRRVQNGELNVPTMNSKISVLSLSSLGRRVEKIAGTPYYYTNVVGETGATGFSSASLSFTEEELASFKLEANYSEAEKAMIPEMPKGFVWKPWMSDTAYLVKNSSVYPEPVRVCYLVGPGGTGKSLGTAAICELLGIPRLYKTCSPEMELFDLLGQIFPNTAPSQRIEPDVVRKELGLPSVDDILIDPATSFAKVFKRPYDGVMSEGDIVCAMVSQVNTEIAKRMENKDYTYVEGPLTKAIRYGYGFELQEVGIIRKPGVVVGLNSIMEASKEAYMILPTGEILRRHPNTVLFFTSNDEYEGTSNLNQSVLSRMSHVVYFENPKISDMAERTKAVVKDFPSQTFKGTPLLHIMAKLISDITEYCRDNEIRSGVCGQRELTNWAMACMIRKKQLGEKDITDEILRETCQTAVVNKVSQNREDIADVAMAIVNPLFGDTALTV